MTFKELSARLGAPANIATGAKAMPEQVKEATPTDTAPTKLRPTKS